MTLAIFDLDETLISADSDHAWGEFKVRTDALARERGRVDTPMEREREPEGACERAREEKGTNIREHERERQARANGGGARQRRL